MSELYQMLGFNLSVPPHVRHAMLSRSFDNDDLLPEVGKPVLLTQGDNDRVVKPEAVYQHLKGLPHAKIMLISKGGHAPFWDNAEIFNSQLREFSESI